MRHRESDRGAASRSLAEAQPKTIMIHQPAGDEFCSSTPSHRSAGRHGEK